MTQQNPIALSQRSTSEELVEIYRSALRIRLFEEKVLELRKLDEVKGSVHLCIGQEMVPAVAARILRSTDPILATYRGHGWALAAGVPMLDMFAEILGRATGTNRGRGGSAYLSSAAHRFIGENSIVGAGLPIANGIAMGSQARGGDDVVLVSFGDGATNQGAAHEALVLAVARQLPVVFVCENNEWSEMTAIRDVVPVSLAERARAYGMDATTVDGTDPIETGAALLLAVERARSGGGPTFVECQVPRMLGHYNADIEHYRSEDDKRRAAARDPLPRLRQRIAELEEPHSPVSAIEAEVRDEVESAAQEAMGHPYPNAATATDHVWDLPADVVAPSLPREGKSVAFGLAINEAIQRELGGRPEALVFGEDVAAPGGVFGVTRNLQRLFGEDRVFDTPIAESSILGGALGASMNGGRPIVEIMWMDFMLVALDQLVNQAANVRYLSSGAQVAPMVVRTQQGVTPGSCAQHTQSLEALLFHIPGIKVGMPSNPQDAFAMTRAAVADDDPVVLIEARSMYLDKGIVDFDAAVEAVGGARLSREGSDLLIVSWGRMVKDALVAADILEGEGIDAGVLDLRWIAPLDRRMLAKAARAHAGRVLVVQEANLTGGVASDISAILYESGDATQVRRLGAPDTRIPASAVLQSALIPDVASIVRTARELSA